MISPRVKIWTEGFLKVGESYVRDFGSVNEQGEYAFTLDKLAASRQHRTNLSNVYFVLVRLKRIPPVTELPVEKKRQLWDETLKHFNTKDVSTEEKLKFVYSIYALESLVQKKAVQNPRTA